MKPSLSLRMGQSLALTPQLQQAIRLLQLSTLELEQEIAQQVDDNPFLEREEPQDWTPPEAALDDLAAATGDANGLPDAWDDQPTSPPDEPWEAPSTSDAMDAPSADVDHQPDHGDAAHEGDDIGSDAPLPDVPTRGESNANAGEATDPFAICAAETSLREHLLAQAAGLRITATERLALQLLIDSLDDDGLLTEALDELIAELLAGRGVVMDALDDEQREALCQPFHIALRLLQSFTPTGVGARDSVSALLLQIRELKSKYRQGQDSDFANTSLELAECLCVRPFADLAKPDHQQLAKQTGSTPDAVRAALVIIGQLTPFPGRSWGGQAAPLLMPDILVKRREQGGQRWLDVQLNDATTPRLRIHEGHAATLKQHRAAAPEALTHRLQEARALVKNLQQRHDTLLRVARCIVQRQAAYFWQGERAMQPLVLRDVADELGLHESTISRITTSKWLQSVHGTVELKHFFSSSLSSEAGATSSTAVRALIKQLIADEDPAHPLSDSQLEAHLKSQGITCARRTVAKYREGLGLAVASERRVRGG